MTQEQDRYRFRLPPLSLCRVDGSILFFGIPLFGGWLPFIGFVTYYDEYDNPVKLFLMEWFLRGLAFHKGEENDIED